MCVCGWLQKPNKGPLLGAHRIPLEALCYTTHINKLRSLTLHRFHEPLHLINHELRYWKLFQLEHIIGDILVVPGGEFVCVCVHKGMQNASVQAKPIEMVAIVKLMRLGSNGDQLAKVSIEATNSLQPLHSYLPPHPTRESIIPLRLPL